MQLIAAFVALLGVAAAMPGAPGYGNGGEKECHTTKTCKAVYETYTKTIPVNAQKTIVTTTYKPVVETTSVYKTITKTKYVPSVYTTTKTIQTSKVVPYETFYYTTICQTSKVMETKSKTVPYAEVQTSPCTTTVPAPYTTVETTPKEYTTQVPSVCTITKEIKTSTTSVCTNTETKCHNKTWCENKPTPTPYESPKPTPKTYATTSKASYN